MRYTQSKVLKSRIYLGDLLAQGGERRNFFGEQTIRDMAAWAFMKVIIKMNVVFGIY